MPLYDYLCAACGARFEVVHGVHADGPTACPVCGKSPVRKAITAAAIHYRGTGWAKKERRATATQGTSTATVEGGSSDSKDAASSGKSDTSDTKSSGTDPKPSTKAAEPSATSASD